MCSTADNIHQPLSTLSLIRPDDLANEQPRLPQPAADDDDDLWRQHEAAALAAVRQGDVAALTAILSSPGLSPLGVLSCLHACSTRPAASCESVIEMARLLLPHLQPFALLSWPLLNPWFVDYDAPALLDVYFAAEVPKPHPSPRYPRAMVDLACFYIHHGCPQNLEWYLRSTKRNVNAPCAQANGTLLHQAAREGSLECVRVLVERFGAHVNAVHDGVTALDEAVSTQGTWTPARTQVVKYLVAMGARRTSHHDLVDALVAYQTKQGRPPLEVLKLLDHTSHEVSG
jgi:ankyrin repeat protein